MWGFPEETEAAAKETSGAEMVEFAIVVVLLIALLYGIISYGLILAAQATITQAAADGARAGIVAVASTAVATAEAQAGTDVGWMNKVLPAGRSSAPTIPSPAWRRRDLPVEPHATVPQGHGHLQLRSTRSSPSCRAWA